jgi:phosphatidylglycerophosphatase A
MKNNLIKLFATGFGSGYSPVVSGTAGTVIGIPLYFALSHFSGVAYLCVTILFTIFSIFVADRAEKLFQKKDDGRIVIDEIAGFLWTMGFVSPSLPHIGLGFVLFRLFDIFKPYPAGYFQDRLPGGYGIVMDDVAAGVYANVMLLILTYCFGL